MSVKRLVQDDERHWYLIPEDELEQFCDWVAEWQGFANFGSTEAYRGQDYSSYHVDIDELRITEAEEVSE